LNVNEPIQQARTPLLSQGNDIFDGQNKCSMSVGCCALCVVLVSRYVRINAHRNKYNAHRTTANGHLTTQTTPSARYVSALSQEGKEILQQCSPGTTSSDSGGQFQP
jgi:hypothetical protein